MRAVIAVVAVVIVPMAVMVGLRVLVIALFAMEHQEVHAEGIEGRDKHPGHHRQVRKASARQVAFGHRFNDAVLGVKAREERCANQGQRTQQGRDPGDGHVLAHAAHPANVLVVVHAHDDRACAQEQQGLEESVRHQVEHRHRVGRGAQGHGHVAQLRQGGIRHHALDVVLNDAQKAHEQRRDRADHQHKVQRGVAEFIEGRHAGHHEDARRHHGGGVNQGGDGGGTFHGVGQPHMQGELRALAHGADEQANADHGHQHPVGAGEAQLAQLAGFGKGFSIVQRATVGGNQANAQNEAEVAHAVHQEGFHVGKDGAGLVKPETDQQIRHQAHGFPTEEQL